MRIVPAMQEPASQIRALTEKEVASRLGISIPTIRRWRATRSGPIQPLRGLGRMVRYSEAELNRYLERGKK